ncbi:MAG: hypothetical protein UY07_C0007G0030 [Parcubacteria group bacterium GW2011_GWA1_47_8]|nr:MAG: hypothetical protein UY07_C0007G0030 [Parcubacteria group bacterium GW2011_GWA1_47_8]KKW07656.1 MAG: hypothetical protein UY42_C0009G0029 [Parcubacteria group bacterium GW2011_GWA2_49_16]
MSEFNKKSAEDLTKLLGENQESLRAFRFGRAGSPKKDVKNTSLLRKDIARILTEMNARTRTIISR